MFMTICVVMKYAELRKQENVGENRISEEYRLSRSERFDTAAAKAFHQLPEWSANLEQPHGIQHGGADVDFQARYDPGTTFERFLHHQIAERIPQRGRDIEHRLKQRITRA